LRVRETFVAVNIHHSLNNLLVPVLNAVPFNIKQRVSQKVHCCRNLEAVTLTSVAITAVPPVNVELLEWKPQISYAHKLKFADT
jgi:hypothetical protein